MNLSIKTSQRDEMIDITPEIQKLIKRENISEGVCFVFVPHTTAAVTINENADRNVRKDLKKILNKIIPWEDGYLHSEGNSAAHMKTSLMGSSEIITIENGRLVLGTWQSVFFCEFDGPRQREIIVKFMPSV